jgi:hypothetical protein
MVAIESCTTTAMKQLWKNNISLKVSIFGWRLLLDKLPTRGALFHRGIINNNNEKVENMKFKLGAFNNIA